MDPRGHRLGRLAGPAGPRAAPNYTAAAMDGLSFEDAGAGRRPSRRRSTSSCRPSRCRTSSAGSCGGRAASSWATSSTWSAPAARDPRRTRRSGRTTAGAGGPDGCDRPEHLPAAGVGLAGGGAHERPGALPRAPLAGADRPLHLHLGFDGSRPPFQDVVLERDDDGWTAEVPDTDGHVLLDCAVAASATTGTTTPAPTTGCGSAWTRSTRTCTRARPASTRWASRACGSRSPPAG